MIYFDNAATTKASEETAKILAYYASERYFNPSSMYGAGVSVKREIEKARENILRLLKGEGNLIFTSGGTESDNTALFSVRKKNGSRIIVSAAEHAAVHYAAAELKQRGYDVVYCPVDGKGRADAGAFSSLMTKDTSMVSIMHVNNETGGVNDLKELVKIAKEINPAVIFHSDGVQAFGKVAVNLGGLGVDLYSVSAHKIHGPKGVGGLFIKKGLNIAPLLIGGGQEGGLRSSTENTGGIIAFSQAAESSVKNLAKRQENAKKIKEYITEKLKTIDGFLPFSDENSSYFILSASFPKVRGEVMQHALEKKNIIIGTGSACSSNKSGKRIAAALGLKDRYKDGIVRISFGDYNTMEEAEIFASEFIKTYTELERYGG